MLTSPDLMIWSHFVLEPNSGVRNVIGWAAGERRALSGQDGNEWEILQGTYESLAVSIVQ